MLERVPLLERQLSDYAGVVGVDVVDRIAELAKPLHGARVLHLNAIAVGIDSVGKLQALHRIGYQFGQGFALAKPDPLPRALRHLDPNAELRTFRHSNPDS